MDHIWLIGMMGSGKSTVGRSLADRLGCPFYDTDAIIEDAAGSTVSELFERAGEAAFREQERFAIADVAGLPPGVVATGGGAVLDQRNVGKMKATGSIVLLAAAVEVAAERIGGRSDRPLLAGRDAGALHSIADDRDERYRAAADVVVDADGSVETVVGLVEAACNAL
jgi:shikimate kinase